MSTTWYHVLLLLISLSHTILCMLTLQHFDPPNPHITHYIFASQHDYKHVSYWIDHIVPVSTKNTRRSYCSCMNHSTTWSHCSCIQSNTTHSASDTSVYVIPTEYFLLHIHRRLLMLCDTMRTDITTFSNMITNVIRSHGTELRSSVPMMYT